MKRLSFCTSCNNLLTIYKIFIHPHLDHSGIIYDKPGNVSFKLKLKIVQCNACLQMAKDQQVQYICRTRPRFTLGKKMASEITFFFTKQYNVFPQST